MILSDGLILSVSQLQSDDVIN